MIEMTMQQIVDEYNKLTGKNIKKFETKTIGFKKLEEARNNSKPIPHKEKEKTYTPKQLEVELGKNQLAIRKKLRKLYPTMAKKGAWRITLEMLDELRKVI